MESQSAFIAILVAIIGGSGIPVWLLTRLDRKNDAQHLTNKDLLDEIRVDISDMKSDVSDVKTNMINHLQHHLEMGDGIERRNRRVARRTSKMQTSENS